MKVKKSVSLLLSVLLILGVFTAAPFAANAETIKYKIECELEGMYVYRIVNGEQEIVTEAEPYTTLYIDTANVTDYDEDYYYTPGFDINGSLNRSNEFHMPAKDVFIAPYKVRKTTFRLPLWDGQPHRYPSVLDGYLLHDDENIGVKNAEDGSYQLLDFGYSGAYDVKLFTEMVYDDAGREDYRAYYAQLLDTADADDTVTLKYTHPAAIYSPVIFELFKPNYKPYNITAPDYIKVTNDLYSLWEGTAARAEEGDILSVSINDDDADLPDGVYLTGEIFVNGKSLGTEIVNGYETFVHDFTMPAEDVTIEAATAQKEDFYLNLSDGKRHEYPAELNPYFYWDLTGGFGDIHGYSEFKWDFNNSGNYDVHFTSETITDENGETVETRYYAQLEPDADAYGVTTFVRENSKYATINFVQVACGDTDGDGFLTVMDATSIQRYLVDLDVKNFDAFRADANCDNDVDIIDATVIQRRIAGYSA